MLIASLQNIKLLPLLDLTIVRLQIHLYLVSSVLINFLKQNVNKIKHLIQDSFQTEMKIF